MLAPLVARSERIANYKTLMSAIRIEPMGIKSMGDVLGVSSDTGRKYYLAMLRFGVIHPAHAKPGDRKRIVRFAVTDDQDKITQFLEFVEDCESVTDELNQELCTAEVNGTVSARTVTMSPATQRGMFRDPLVSALFGEPQQHGAQ